MTVINHLKTVILIILIFCISCGVSSTNKVIQGQIADTPKELSELDYWKDYTILDAEYGTKTSVVIKNGYRIIETNALPNHKVGAFPNPGNPNSISAQKHTYKIPAEPKLSRQSKWARQPGVALNGIKFEPETAERFVCETGEIYRIEAFQDLVDLGLDTNNAHVQPTGTYHYHGIPIGLVKALEPKEDLVLVGFALDGFPIYYSLSGKYKPSFKLSQVLRTGDVCNYSNPHQSMDKILKDTRPDGTFVSDWEYVEGKGQLDECNGMDINGEYAYFVTIEYPYMGRCLKGEFREERRGPPPGRRPNGPPPRRG